jgi:2-polyprenyl-6-methoxyphenol hydroxylase-like FAD-dependent oxidoreductase
LRRAAVKAGAKIRFGSKFVRYEVDALSKKVTAFFEDGSSFQGDLLVGCDGARSKVRSQLIKNDNFLRDIGVIQVGFAIPVDRLTSVQSNGADNKSIQSLLNRSNRALLRLFGPDSVSWLILRYHDEDLGKEGICIAVGHPIAGIEGEIKEHQSPLDSLKYLRAKASLSGSPELITFTNALKEEDLNVEPKKTMSSDAALVAKLPSLVSETDRASVVLLGDAAHAMTTHRGLGANTAFEDAYDLADTLHRVTSSSNGNFALALDGYTQRLAKRGSAAVSGSLQSTTSMFVSGWRASLRDWFMWTLGCLVSIYRFFGRIFWSKPKEQ